MPLRRSRSAAFKLAIATADYAALFARIDTDPDSAAEIAPGVTRAELAYAVDMEDVLTAEDFLLRRTKLHLLLDQSGRDAVQDWFATKR